MRELISSAPRRAELGERGRAYVVEHHDAAVIGKQLEELYQGIRPRGVPGIMPGWTAPQVQRRLMKAQETIEVLKGTNRQLRSNLTERADKARADRGGKQPGT